MAYSRDVTKVTRDPTLGPLTASPIICWPDPTRPLIQITIGTASCCCTKLTLLNPVRIRKIYLKVFQLKLKKKRDSKATDLNVLKYIIVKLEKMCRKWNGWHNQRKFFIKCLCNKNQLDALFILSKFRQSTSTCFGHICSPSSGGILYIYNNLYVLCFLVLLSVAVSRCTFKKVLSNDLKTFQRRELYLQHTEVELRVKQPTRWTKYPTFILS